MTPPLFSPHFVSAVIAAVLLMPGLSAMAQPLPAAPASPAQPPAAPSVIERVRKDIEALTAVKEQNAELLVKQQATLKTLEELEATARQLRIFAR